MAHKKTTADDEAQTVEQSPPAAPEADRRTIDAWAELAGYPPSTPGYWKFTAASAFKGWSRDALVTRDEVEAAMSEEAKQVTR